MSYLINSLMFVQLGQINHEAAKKKKKGKQLVE